MTDLETSQTTVNDSRTEVAADTNVTHDCSGFDLTYENDRRALHHARKRDGAHSPDGHTYSNIMELRENWEKSKPGDYCQQNIPRLMLVQERRLAVKS